MQGYGFLSENATFVDICKDHGIEFIGPTSAHINTMGDKINSSRHDEGVADLADEHLCWYSAFLYCKSLPCGVSKTLLSFHALLTGLMLYSILSQHALHRQLEFLQFLAAMASSRMTLRL